MAIVPSDSLFHIEGRDVLQNIRERLIHIHRCQGIPRRSLRKFFRYDPELTKIYTLSPSELSQIFSLPMKKASLFYNDLHNPHLAMQIKKDISTYSIVTIVDDHYPCMLKPIKDPPLVLYALGNIKLLQQTPTLSVVGTRFPSRNAKQKTKYIIKPLLDYHWTIVSGMAKGIDSYAHELALTYNSGTIAVLGGGFHHIYPRVNVPLFKQIVRKGLVLSEYAPDTPPRKYHFPERNRIISGLSFGTVVIEAAEKSGTLITVDHALEQGREVYAVPGSPLLSQTKGCHQLIQDGAKLVHVAEDIVEDWENIGIHYKYLE